MSTDRPARPDVPDRPGPDLSPATRRLVVVGVVLAALALVVAVGVLLDAHAPGNMGRGFLSGAGVGVLAALVMAWRALRRPADATTFERSWTQTGDERDDAVLTRALAVLGLLSLPLTAAAAIAVALGAAVEMVFALLLLALVVVGATSFLVIDRRS